MAIDLPMLSATNIFFLLYTIVYHNLLKGENIDRWYLRQSVLAIKLEDIEREKFDELLAKHQICQYFPPSINCAIQYLQL